MKPLNLLFIIKVTFISGTWIPVLPCPLLLTILIIRKLSLTLQLTDPSQYKGGDFQFRWLNSDAQRETVTVKDAKDLGTIIIFPSFIYHRVKAVKEGKRYSLVVWAHGDNFK